MIQSRGVRCIGKTDRIVLGMRTENSTDRPWVLVCRLRRRRRLEHWKSEAESKLSLLPETSESFETGTDPVVWYANWTGYSSNSTDSVAMHFRIRRMEKTWPRIRRADCCSVTDSVGMYSEETRVDLNFVSERCPVPSSMMLSMMSVVRCPMRSFSLAFSIWHDGSWTKLWLEVPSNWSTLRFLLGKPCLGIGFWRTSFQVLSADDLWSVSSVCEVFELFLHSDFRFQTNQLDSLNHHPHRCDDRQFVLVSHRESSFPTLEVSSQYQTVAGGWSSWMRMDCVLREAVMRKSIVREGEVGDPVVPHILVDGRIDYGTAAAGGEQRVWPYCHPCVALLLESIPKDYYRLTQSQWSD